MKENVKIVMNPLELGRFVKELMGMMQVELAHEQLSRSGLLTEKELGLGGCHLTMKDPSGINPTIEIRVDRSRGRKAEGGNKC